MKRVASRMTDEVMAAFQERIGTREWLDEESSQRCQRKVSHDSCLNNIPLNTYSDTLHILNHCNIIMVLNVH